MDDQAGNDTNDYESTITTGAENNDISFSCHPHVFRSENV
jgi:hypothetical protein